MHLLNLQEDELNPCGAFALDEYSGLLVSVTRHKILEVESANRHSTCSDLLNYLILLPLKRMS